MVLHRDVLIRVDAVLPAVRSATGLIALIG